MEFEIAGRQMPCGLSGVTHLQATHHVPTRVTHLLTYGVAVTLLAEETRHLMHISDVAAECTSGSQYLWWVGKSVCNMRVQRETPAKQHVPNNCPPGCVRRTFCLLAPGRRAALPVSRLVRPA